MARPCILVVANVEGFALCKDNLYPFCNHYAVLEVAVEFLIYIYIYIYIYIFFGLNNLKEIRMGIW